MYLMRIGPVGKERPYVSLGRGQLISVADAVADFDGAFFAAGGVTQLADVVADRTRTRAFEDPAGERVGSPIARPHQIVCVGLNYRDHADESGMDLPAEPVLFNKAPNTMVGPNDPVIMPRDSRKLDWEIELGVVIGRRSSYLADEREAAHAIAGYVMVNDVSERAFQFERGGQWVKGKSAPTFNPCGPLLATPDEIPDVRDLDMSLEVNGVRRQTGTTSQMLFGPEFIVQYVSQFMVLEPGDLINTGTPAGVGLGQRPPLFLDVGDVMELRIDFLGTQRQAVVGGPSRS